MKDEVIRRNLDRIHISAAAPLPSNHSRHSQVSLIQKKRKNLYQQIKKKSSWQTMHPIKLKFKNMFSPLWQHHKCAVSHRLIKRFQRKRYLIFFFNPIWLPNHVTYQLFLNKPVLPRLGKHFCEVSPWSVQPFWRRKFFYRFLGKSNVATKPCDLWHHMCYPFVPHE